MIFYTRRYAQGWYLALAAVAFLLGSAKLFSKETGDQPTSLIITYKARPESRARFYSYMGKDGLHQFAQWKIDGIFRGYQILFSSYAAADSFDLMVVLDFERYSDIERWENIEKRMPGGLSDEALSMAAPSTSSLTTRINHGEAPDRDPAKARYMILQYDLMVDAAHYKKYAEGYGIPQFKGWMSEGVLTAYSSYVNQNVGGPWMALVVLEYRDVHALARRDQVKAKIRAQLDSDAAWKAFSTGKTEVRKEKAATIAAAVTGQ